MKPIRISVIIVSYNVKFFLEQCLKSVYRAGRGIPMEVFVVDNHSADGSCVMVRNQFPDVKIIENTVNTGFSRANNQAMCTAAGEFQLILNPDTVVEESTFIKILEFMDNHAEAGALGVRMIDGKGSFLPESKRALPTPMVSFYKVFGLTALFPRSHRFGQYHLGYLPQDEVNPVDILPGAFMFIRKSVLDQIGYFDESFFMYGEDIDLSYRILQAGYRNYYFPETTIIHYKGESTKKASLNYVLMFYQAMIIFATKHFSKSNARWFSFFIHLSVYFRATISMIRRVVSRAFIPLADATISFLGFLLINPTWESIKFPNGGHHPPEFLILFVPAYIFIWLLAIYFSGGYDLPVKLIKILRGIVYGSAIILVLYSLLPEEYRFSRALILLGSVWTLTGILLIRLTLHFAHLSGYRLDIGNRKKLVIVGKPEESERVSRLIAQTNQPVEVFGFVNPDPSALESGKYLGSVLQLSDIIRVNHINEVIFCAKDLSTNEIIKHMLALSSLETEYKIAPEASESIIGSNSANTAGDLYVIPINSVGEPHNRRLKRVFDVTLALVLLGFSPVTVWFFLPRPWLMLWNCLRVLAGVRSWVGYAESGFHPGYHLPPLRKGILKPENGRHTGNYNGQIWLDLNLHYARDYYLLKDIRILAKGYKSIVQHTRNFLLTIMILVAILPHAEGQDYKDQINMIRPKPDNCLVYGVISLQNKELLPDIPVSLIDSKSHETESIMSDRNAWYLFSVKKGLTYGLLIEKDGYFPYYAEYTVPFEPSQNKIERNIILPDDLKNDFSLYYPAADTVLGEKSQALLAQLTALLNKHPELSVWFDPQGDSLDFARINLLTSAFISNNIDISRLRTGSRPDSTETFLRIEINTGPENFALVLPSSADQPPDEFWTIQFSATKTSMNKKFYRGLSPVHEFKGKDGFYRYSYGTFKTREEANRKLLLVKKKGFKKPIIKTAGSIKKL
ncbi:MAG: glycosyltransferase [Bacteroidia bacterium]|nr:glycosyltransferase [Bacteroidia bacterium]